MNDSPDPEMESRIRQRLFKQPQPTLKEWITIKVEMTKPMPQDFEQAWMVGAQRGYALALRDIAANIAESPNATHAELVKRYEDAADRADEGVW